MDELVEAMQAAALTWQDRVRRGLTSDDVRLRLHTYSTLSEKCSESKETQKQVGQLFGGPRSGTVSRFAGSSLLNVLFDDLRSTDRTLRIAAARVLCLMAYENLTNQQLIIRSQAGGDEEMIGVTVGWVHAFFIPQSLRDRYEAQCEERGLFTTPIGLTEFVSKMIKDNYASAYTRIGRYYAGGCHEFLPMCWFQALVNDSSEATDMIDVPDPDENLVGFYLVPRQMQFPEHDDYLLQEILSSIRTEAELSRLQQVHTAFQQVAFRAPAKEANTTALKTALQGILKRETDNNDEAFVTNMQHAKLLQWLDVSPERTVTWNELLVWCCTDMNADEMLKRFGADAYRTVDLAFQKLSLSTEGRKDSAVSYVWEPALVGTVLNRPDLPGELKENLRSLSCSYVSRLEVSRRKLDGNTASAIVVNNAVASLNDEGLDRPWEHLLRLELAEIHPVSWSVFLSKWRQGADSKPDGDEVHIYHQNERRHHSVHEGANSSVMTARKNALATMTPNHRIFHSFRDLNQLRQQLPLITNRPSAIIEETFEVPSSIDRLLTPKTRLSEAEELQLEENRKLFRRLQQTPSELDELTRQQLKEKRIARCKAHERAAENRKKAAQLVVQRQQEFERVKRERQGKAQERVRRQERRCQLLSESRQERHERAQRWKQSRLEDEIQRQDEYMAWLHEQRDAAARLEQSQYAMNQMQRSFPQPPSTPPTRERKLFCPKRPLSARTATEIHIVRERAHVYGCAATKVFSARRPQTARADFYSGNHSSRGRQRPASFRRQTRPVNDGATGNRQNEVANVYSSNTSGSNDRQASAENACETLVMTNAAHAVAQHIAIPSVTAPTPEEEVVPPGIIMAQYLALEKEQRFKLHERYCANRVSHKLMFAVLQQLTQEMRQDAAWREFLRAAGGPVGTNTTKRNKSKREAKVTYAAFAGVANQLGIPMPPKKLQAVARSLDPWKTGFVSWESFYTWWSSQ